MTTGVGGQGLAQQIRQQMGQAVAGAVQHLAQALVGAAVRVDDLIYRQQVPADRWFYDFKADFTTTKEEFQARGWAILHTLEGAVRAAVEGIRILVAKYITNTQQNVGRHETILNAQIQSLKYTAVAIIDPVGLKKTTQEELGNGQFPVGCSRDAFHWGDKYEGTLTIPISFDYNWHPMD